MCDGSELSAAVAACSPRRGPVGGSQEASAEQTGAAWLGVGAELLRGFPAGVSGIGQDGVPTQGGRMFQ